MTQTNDRNEEVKRRVLMWEEKHNKKLQECNHQEWIEAIANIMCLTEYEAEDYLSYLLAQQEDKDLSTLTIVK
jgi:hypothetical protein